MIAGGTLYFSFIAPYSAKAIQGAESSPFSSGFVSLIAELVARVGVLYLAAYHSEFVPLWWIPLFILGLILLRWRYPLILQSDLSPTAKLCGYTALIAAGIMVVLTATIIPVGVEFLPPRLLYCFPAFFTMHGEWILRRHTTLRWPLLIAFLNLFVLGLGYDAAARALAIPSPAPTAPFLHATYLAPSSALLTILPNEGSGKFVVFEDEGIQFALEQAGYQPDSVTQMVMLDSSPSDLMRTICGIDPEPAAHLVLIGGPLEFWVCTSTRDLTPNGERKRWEDWLFKNCDLEQECQFVHEDPIWLWLKSHVLRREVNPYKWSLRHYRFPATRR